MDKKNRFTILTIVLTLSVLTPPVFAGEPDDLPSDLIKISSPDSGAIYTRFYPSTIDNNGDSAPLIFFLGGSEGGILAKDESVIQDLQSEGYNVVTAGYFKMPGISKDLSQIDLEPFGKAIDYFKNQSGVDPDRIGVIGVSKGAELALILGSLYPDIHLVVGVVPSSVAFQGCNIAIFSHNSSWRYGGEELPFVPYPQFSWAAIKGVFSGENYRDMHLLALENESVVEQARIPVERINGPLFLLSAKLDQYWPSTPMAEAMMQQLDAHNFKFPHRHIAWDSDHAVLEDPEAWNSVLVFIREQWER